MNESIVNQEVVNKPKKARGPSMEETGWAFHNLLIDEVFVHPAIKQSFENGLQGLPLLSAQEMSQYVRIELSEILGSDNAMYQQILKNHGFILSDNQIKDLIITTWSCDELIPITLRTKYGWGFPTEEAIVTIVEQLENVPGLIEVGAGSGLWSAIIKSRTDKEVIACELNLRSDTPKPKFYNVENMDANILIDNHPDYATLLVWTDTNTVGIEIAQKLKAGNKLIIAGPIDVTGSSEFYKYLDENFNIQQKSSVSSFAGGVDQVYVLEKTLIPKIDDYFSSQKTKNKMIEKIKQLKNKTENTAVSDSIKNQL